MNPQGFEGGEEEEGEGQGEEKEEQEPPVKDSVYDKQDNNGREHSEETGRFVKKGQGGGAAKSQQSPKKREKEEEKMEVKSEKPKPQTSEEEIAEFKRLIRQKAIKLLKGKSPIIEIKGNEFEGKTIEEKRNNAKSFFENTLRNKSFKNISIGKEIRILGGKKSFSEAGYEDKINSIKYLPELLKNSLYIGFAKDTAGRSNVKGSHYFAAKIATPKDVQLLILSAREDNNGNVYYNHHITEEAMDSVKAGIQSGTGTTASKNSIQDGYEEVKPEFWFFGEE